MVNIECVITKNMVENALATLTLQSLESEWKIP